jgi:glycosyltransferase involved in cell wall biosynthesis
VGAQQCEALFEVIVVDNGSTDDTASVLQRWSRQDPRFRNVFESKLGLSCGKNAGIRNARAPLLLFTDDDTLVDPRWIQTYLTFFAAHRADLIVAGGTQVPIPHDLGPWPDWFDDPSLAEVGLLRYEQQRTLGPSEYVWGANMAIPRSVFDVCGAWNENVGPRGADKTTFEDTEFQDRVHAHGIAVWYCPDAVIRHRVDRGVITPRRICSTTFLRGRNKFWQDTIPQWHDISRVPRRNMATCLARLAANLCRWAWWALAFRVRPQKSFFERARRAAFESGRVLDSLRAGRRSVRLYLIVGRFAFGVRQILLRLSPDAV